MSLLATALEQTVGNVPSIIMENQLTDMFPIGHLMLNIYPLSDLRVHVVSNRVQIGTLDIDKLMNMNWTIVAT
jgi:hypothetical protein